eukprot:CAMPEP_0119140224 /NCGR_PEP_ID=MMETSP1310-20130426/28840_1 /TAXON_ID=464262 /ORGANISM="Genus nov. species nov., Strain RCC2339" /LENGTH=107 /DNA_ID=CAMNT_0007131565 /DNA_START=14 /DNA_END=334 /DNA_ORIENTATION=+
MQGSSDCRNTRQARRSNGAIKTSSAMSLRTHDRRFRCSALPCLLWRRSFGDRDRDDGDGLCDGLSSPWSERLVEDPWEPRKTDDNLRMLDEDRRTGGIWTSFVEFAS